VLHAAERGREEDRRGEKRTGRRRGLAPERQAGACHRCHKLPDSQRDHGAPSQAEDVWDGEGFCRMIQWAAGGSAPPMAAAPAQANKISASNAVQERQ
jgi:hypothetical protein